MRAFVSFSLFAATIVSCDADYTLEEISPHFSTNTAIVWQAPMHELPKRLWLYRQVPTTFSATSISNAIILASFQDKGFPKPSTNHTVIWDNRFKGEPKPPYFSIIPEVGQMSFTLGDRVPRGPEGIATNHAAVERAWDCLTRLGLDLSQFVKTNEVSSGGYGVFIPKQIDGILVYGNSQGFQIQFGKDGKVQQFCLLLPKLERGGQSEIASPSQIVACIRAFKTPSPPNADESDYFGRIKILSKARKLTITKITPYYSEGMYGEAATDASQKVVTPIAELEAIAEFTNSAVTVKLLAPILASETSRLLSVSSKPHQMN